MRETRGPEFIFALHLDGDGPPEECRVKRLLKELGRKHRLRVTFPPPAATPLKHQQEDYGRVDRPDPAR